jgi:MtrB/PioB family decaheme-associated outer membrane protein
MSSFKAALAASVCLLPLPALAQSDQGFGIEEAPAAAAAPPVTNNWVTVGGQYNSGPSYYLGRYSGAVDPGFYGIGDFRLGQRDAWDSGGTNYWQVQGSNLGFWDRSFEAKAGQQGTWGVTFSYQGIPYYATDSFQSVFQPNGALVPGVAPGSLGARMTPILPAVNNPYRTFPGFAATAAPPGALFPLFMPSPTNRPQLWNYDISTRRDVFAGTGKWQWGGWTITGAIRHEHKSGFYINSAVIAGGAPAVTSAGSKTAAQAAVTPGMTGALAYFPQPVDYDTDRYDLTAAYATERYQAQVGYTFSRFNDNNTGMTLQNPFAFFPASNSTLAASFGAGATPGSLYAPYALPPSNSAHQVKVLFGYNITPTTRLNANFAYSVEMQNEGYLTGTGDPATHQILPRSSFDGLVQTEFGNIALTAQPLPRLDVRVAYTIDNRDNQSPRNPYDVFQRSDVSNGIYYNMPFSYHHQIATAEAGYRILPQTKFTVTDTFDYTHRNYSDTSVVTSNTIGAKIRSSVTPWMFASLSYAHQDRNAHNYNPQGWWQAVSGPGIAPGDAEPTNFVMFFEASRKHDEVKAMVDLSPDETVTASFIVKFSNDRYPDTTYGLRNNHNLSVGPDVSWQPTKRITAHAYYTYQQIYYDQASVYESSTTSTPNTSATGTGYIVPWSAKTTDSVHTLGVNADWQAIPDVLKVSLDYNLSYGDTAYALGEGVVAFGGAISSPTFLPSITTQSLPDVKSLLSVISIHGEYTFRPNMTLLVGYAWERFNYKDFMVGTSATQYANALLPGMLAPNESVHVVSAALRFRF